MYFYNPKDRNAKELIPGATIRTFWGEKLLLSIVEIAPGAVIPNHTHPHEQAGILLDGELEFTIDGQTRILKPGEVYIIPGNVEHKVKAGSVSAKALDIFSPVREEYKY